LGDLPKGYDHKYTYSHIGYNMKVSDMQAALGVSQLTKLDHFIARRRENFVELEKRLRAAGLDRYYHLPQPTPGTDPSWFGYLMTVRDGAGFARNDVTRALEERKVGTRLLFAGNIIRQPAFKDVAYRVHGGLTNTDKLMEDAFWVGIWPGIDAQRMDYMVETLSDITQALLTGRDPLALVRSAA
ncbi:MAG: lipopolysaccharide biosynthesis protein RfbH, partial [Sphingomonadales bacterium]